MTWLIVATIVFLANFALGLGVRSGRASTRSFSWVHHALFFAVALTAAVTVAVGLLRSDRYVLPLVGALAIFAVLPRFAGGSARHTWAAVGALGCYVCAYALRLT